ncbi:MAG: DNA-processing protein DprA [Planctomycetaceae bacterium]|nr:DNA-processing protein DprA [Planctomycetaceae bacterium]
MNDERINEILLTMVEGVGSLTFKRLYDHFGSCESILSASAEQLQIVGGVGPKIASQIASARETYSVEGLLELCRREKIEILSQRDERYPELLRLIHDPPQILYVKGTLTPQDALAFAVIGTRQMSSYGKRLATQLTRGLVQYGVTIISGLAKGIDGAAHRAALEMQGRTIAVLGGGIGRIYPKEHTELAERIVENGALISEYHPLMEPNKGTFPQRNRIVSGMSIGVLVVEAPKKSGAMITARLAYEQGRELFAVPGNVDSVSSGGCNQLLRDGAILVESVDDIFESLGPLFKPVQNPATAAGNNPVSDELRHPGEFPLNEIERTVLRHVGITVTPLEQIVRLTELNSHQVLVALNVLLRRNLIIQGNDGFRRI